MLAWENCVVSNPGCLSGTSISVSQGVEKGNSFHEMRSNGGSNEPDESMEYMRPLKRELEREWEGASREERVAISKRNKGWAEILKQELKNNRFGWSNEKLSEELKQDNMELSKSLEQGSEDLGAEILEVGKKFIH